MTTNAERAALGRLFIDYWYQVSGDLVSDHLDDVEGSANAIYLYLLHYLHSLGVEHAEENCDFVKGLFLADLTQESGE